MKRYFNGETVGMQDTVFTLVSVLFSLLPSVAPCHFLSVTGRIGGEQN